MTIVMEGGLDVVSFLKEQHEEIKAAFERVLESSGKERKHLFRALRQLLMAHETAEEEFVHPLARQKLTDGEIIVSARLQEEQEAQLMLGELENLEVDSKAFERTLSNLSNGVQAHARAEEQNEFETLGPLMDQVPLERLRQALSQGELRTQSGRESAFENILSGSFGALLHRTRDAVLSRK